jgi:uncharacterized phage-like protein YoqJ
MRIAVTGHRPNKLGNEYNLNGPITTKIKLDLQRLINHLRPFQMISGMALGVDTIWAILALENNIPLIAAIPCINQESKWPESSQKRYKEILSNPLTIIEQVSNESYSNECMQNRNIWMVNNCDLLIGVWDKTGGGTANCLKYADSIGKKVILVNLD